MGDATPRRKLFIRSTLFAYWGLLFVLTHLPAHRISEIAWTVDDSLAHYLVYAVLTILFIWAYPGRTMTNLGYFLSVSAIFLIYAFIDELLQDFVPGRVADAWDFVADGLGVLSVLTARWLVLRWTTRPTPSNLLSTSGSASVDDSVSSQLSETNRSS